MFTVYKVSPGGVRRSLTSFDREAEAIQFCTDRDWEWCDENGFVWGLDYREHRCMYAAYRVLPDGTQQALRVFEHEIDAADYADVNGCFYQEVRA